MGPADDHCIDDRFSANALFNALFNAFFNVFFPD
jgi:hypothetical protein